MIRRFHQLHAAGKLITPDETRRARFTTLHNRSAGRGLAAYEVSNHARAGGEWSGTI